MAFSLGFWAAIAATLGGGGGKVMAPSKVTVAPRMTSSSMLWTGLPSLAGVHLPSTATATASFLTSPGSLVVVVVVLEIS